MATKTATTPPSEDLDTSTLPTVEILDDRVITVPTSWSTTTTRFVPEEAPKDAAGNDQPPPEGQDSWGHVETVTESETGERQDLWFLVRCADRPEITFEFRCGGPHPDEDRAAYMEGVKREIKRLAAEKMGLSLSQVSGAQTATSAGLKGQTI